MRREGQVETSLLVHIGYHKTGTTWLQSGLFSDEGLGFERVWGSKEIRSRLVLPTPLEWDEAASRNALGKARREASERGRIPVLSDERLSGSPHAGGFDSAQTAERIAKIVPDGRVLIVIREQRRVVYSVYQQFVRDGGAASLRRYLEPRRPAEVPQFRWEHFEYDRLVGRYQELFGRERVLVLPFELLTADSAEFVRRILEFAGLQPATRPEYPREYPSLQASTVVLKRWVNRFFVRNSLNPSGLVHVPDHELRFERVDRWLPRWLSAGVERRWRAYLDHATVGRFEESNARTAAITNLDLAALGYRVPAPGSALAEGPGRRAGEA
jgi:hypothetical protein